MPTELRVEKSDEFLEWVDSVDDVVARVAIFRRIDRLAAGNPGDFGPVGAGVSELRVHVGAGWRVYYVRRNDAYVLLWGGSKRTQDRDIARAQALALEV